ncbi:3-deoxy-D-manno-octulosonic acid transferase [Arachidicoccus sp.]|uniref:3-deoxy-D-manno-octulosonic acid transferase n=1 Tax=Arachidicoccus sp. TaxID=1872624 RepID=UPI003D21C535
MNLFFYRLFIFLYAFGVDIASIFNRKARLWKQGRIKLFKKIRKAFKENTSPVIWFHCASLGEFEQGRPLLEKLKHQHPTHKILLTFFSPSGYEVHKNYALADYVFYLPLDGEVNARKFLSIVQPQLVIFVKYEFWYFYLKQIKQKQIPLLLVSAIFRENQPFFKWYGSLHRTMLQYFSHIFIQDTVSQELLKSIHIINTTICGDTRVDRVIEIAKNWSPVEQIEEFCNNHPVIVAGSTWDEDDEVLNHYANKNVDTRFIIAPHEIDTERLHDCLHIYKQSILYSQYLREKTVDASINTIIIDNIGMLSRLYKYADICFIGGAFGEDGVHNVLEAAVYNKPVVFGPVFDKFLEAVELEASGAAFSVENILELEETFNDLLENQKLYYNACDTAKNYLQSKSGATGQILLYIENNILS